MLILSLYLFIALLNLIEIYVQFEIEKDKDKPPIILVVLCTLVWPLFGIHTLFKMLVKFIASRRKT